MKLDKSKLTPEEQRYLTDWQKTMKSADQKLRRIEKLAENEGYKQILNYAYAEAMNALKSYGGGKRFDTAIPLTADGHIDIRKAKRKMNVAQQFMDKPTSTKRGIEKVYNTRTETIKKKYGVALSPSQTKAFYDSALWKKLDTKFGSKTALKVIGKIQGNREDVLKLIKKSNETHQSIPNLVEKIQKNPQYYSKDLGGLVNGTLYNDILDDDIYDFMSKNKKQLLNMFDE